MRRIAFPLAMAGTFAVAALGAHAMSTGDTGSTRVVDVRNSSDDLETPDPSETPDAPDDSDGLVFATETPSASETPDTPDDSDGRNDDDNSGSGHGGDEDRSGSNSGPG